MVDEDKIIQKSVSGNPILINDVSEIPHNITLHTAPNGEINVCGKNLLNVNDVDFTIQGVHFKGENGSLILNGTSSGEISGKYSNWANYFSFVLPKGKYTFTLVGDIAITSTQTFYVRDVSNAILVQLSSTERSKSFTLEDATRVSFAMYIYKQTYNNTEIKLQIESGSRFTDFEPCKVTKYRMSATGEANIPSISPNMFITEANGNYITADYQKSYGMELEWDRFCQDYLFAANKSVYSYCYAGNRWTDEILEKIEDPLRTNGLWNLNYSYVFYYNTVITKTPIIHFGNASSTTTPFYQCKNLKEIYFDGEIHTSLNMVHSPLSKGCIERIINGLSDTTSGLTVAFNKTAVNTAFETSGGAADGSTSAEWLALTATKSNWTISLY